MSNKQTRALTTEQYRQIIDTIENGFLGCRPNHRVATALRLEANLGLRINDILELRLNNIVWDCDRYRLDIIEQKTGKKREFTVPTEITEYIRRYNREHKIEDDERIFPITERAIQKHLKAAVDYLGYPNVGTHSFRKFFATQIYKNNEYNIILVQKLLQHSSPAITQRYIGISTQEVEQALSKHICL